MGGAPDAPVVVNGRVTLVLVRVPAGLADWNLDGVPEAECAFGEGTPGEELAVGGEGAVVVVAEDDGDDGLVLELGDDRWAELVDEWVERGDLFSNVLAHQDGGACTGRVGKEGMEGG